MASLSYSYGAFMFFVLASTIISCGLAASSANAATTNDESLETLKKLTKESMGRISKITPDFAPKGTLEKLIINTSPSDKVALSALGSCREIFSLAVYNLNSSLPRRLRTCQTETLDTSLAANCAALSYLESCIDGFNSSVPQIHNSVSTTLSDPISVIRNSSKAVYQMSKSTFAADQQQYDYITNSDRSPSWFSSEDRELIESASIKPDIVVAQDGSGNYKTISEAVKVAPRQRKQRFFIHVKKGVYFENVTVDADQWNLVIFGDGMDKTIVVAEMSTAGGKDIFTSATFAVHGKRFIARDIGFYNKAGAAKGPAVALLSDSDRSVFYKCRIDGYQDALNANAWRQFFRECHIYGTIDFIFGGGSVVFQASTIYVKRPLPGQGNAITAHAGRNRAAGRASSYNRVLSRGVGGSWWGGTALGRPWKPYSTVVFIDNYMESVVSPIGWIPMNGTPPNTIFLAEYKNRGPGSNVAGRVKWSGVRPNISSDEANLYTVSSLIGGQKWIPSTNVTFNAGL